MSRYIDIEPYEKDGGYLQKRYHNSYGEVIKTTPLVSVPTAEAEPIKHGEWLPYGEWQVECSVCGFVATSLGEGHYCPYCGAKMDEVE